MKSLVLCCGLILVLLLCDTAQTRKQRCKRSSQGTDCTQIKCLNPEASSGVYEIGPFGVEETLEVYCEMEKDEGWMVLQRHSGEKVNFHRNWEEYKNGFGSLMEDHWLGLSKMYSVTQSKTWTLRVDLSDHEGGTAFAQYQNFTVGNEESAFQLHVGQYEGTAGDAFYGAYPGIDQNSYGFSTNDHDNDGCSPCISGGIAMNKCTDSGGGGWWYSSCGSANLNGDWHPYGSHIGWESGLYWKTWKSPIPYSLKSSRMMIKSV